MICLKCNSFQSGFLGRLCPVCSEPLKLETNSNLDKLVIKRLDSFLSNWQASGIVSKNAIGEIKKAIDTESISVSHNHEETSFGFMIIFLDWFQNLITTFLTSLGALFEPMILSPKSTQFLKKNSGKESDANYENLTEAVFGSSDELNSLSGIDAVSALDEKPQSKKGKYSRKQFKNLSEESEFKIWAGLRPLFNEYIWWFVGSLLVLTGSIMGIREAWLVLTGISRHITVISTVFTYQALFVGLGQFLGARSKLTGRLLSGISLLLLPVSFSVVSDVIIENNLIGFGVLTVLSILTYGILIIQSKQFKIKATDFILPILPSVIILSILPNTGKGIISILLSFIPFLFVSQMGIGVIKQKEGSKGLLLLSIYGALSVLIIFLNLDGNSPFALGSISFGVFLLWVLAISSILVMTFGMLSIEGESKKIYVVLEILFLAVTLVIASTSGLFIFANSLNEFDFNSNRIIYLILPILVSLLFFDTIERHEAAIHPFMLLSIFSSYILTSEFLPLTNWSYAAISLIPVTGLLFAEKKSNRMRNILYVWGTIAGISSCFILLSFELVLKPIGFVNVIDLNQRLLTVIPMLFSGFYFGSISHWVGGRSRSALHILAAFGTYTVLQALVKFFLPEAEFFSQTVIAFGLVCISYYFVAGEFERRSNAVYTGSEKNDSLFQPMDDISFLAGTLSFLGILFTSMSGKAENSIFIAIGLTMILRSFRDRSSFSSLLGSLLISIALYRLSFLLFDSISISTNTFVSASIAVGFGFLCLFFPNLSPAKVKSRKIFFVIRLPFPADGLVLIRNAFSATSILYAIYSVSLIFQWLGMEGQPERNLVIISGILLSLVFVITFFTRAFNFFYLRGSTVSLGLIFFCIGLAAVANRIGRPLPPTVVGVNLTLGIIGLWIFSRLLFHKGQVLSSWLDDPSQGRFYHHVPLTTMNLLGFVLILDVLLLQPFSIARFLFVTPPTFFIGAGLAALFYSRSIQSLIPLHFSLGLFIFAAAIGFAQESFLGTPLVALDLPGSRWVPAASRVGDWLDPAIFLPSGLSQSILIRRSALGIAGIGAFYALAVLILPLSAVGKLLRKAIFKLEDFLPLQFLFSSWSVICIGILSLIAFQYAFVAPGLITLVGGGLLVLAGHSKVGNLSIALSGLFIIHGLAHLNSNYPIWAGPGFAGIAYIMILSVKPLSFISKKPYSKILESFHSGAFIYSMVGLVYAFATLSASGWDNAVPSLLIGLGFGMGGLWMQTLALGITSGIIALSLFTGGLQWTKILSTFAAMLSMLALGFAGVTSFPVLCQYGICSVDNTVQTLPEMLPYFALILTIVSAFAYFLSEYIKSDRKDFSSGAGYGSDILIIGTGILLVVFIRLEIVSNLLFSNYALILSIIFVVFISALASYKTRKPRHLYFTQTSIVSLYLAFKPVFPEILTPEIDAIAALLFGFVLTGITSVAHRAGIPPLEESTRRFAALMPLVGVVVLPNEASYENAGMATFSAALYAALAIASSNRIYAVLAAVAANIAIFTAIVSSQVQGIEIYLAPLGLFSLFLGHIFRENLTDQARKIVRIGGGLFLYLPAAVNISFEMGRAQDASYAVVFGLLCLAGIAAGMVFQIRSYLFMGISFFTLNLVANILQTGLRDQYKGFILLSFAGLFIIGSLVFYTLRKDQILGFAIRVKNDLDKWD